MLRKLYINNMFKHQDVTFEFHKGLTGIIGPNESGKSLITEAVRYALFGSAALRGLAEDYKGLHVELEFTVNGVDYKVVRKGARAELEGGVRASATKPVNEAIRRILGYDLIVFDVANSCNQGDVEGLSKMRPAERKAMVDQTVGLNVLDDIIKHCGDEGNALKREAAGLERTLIEPEALTVPENLMVLADAQDEYAEAKAKANEYRELRGALSSAPEKPKKPKACKVKDSVQILKGHQDVRELMQKSAINTSRQIEALELRTMSDEVLDEIKSQHDVRDRWEDKKRLLAQGEIECPKCNHSWPVAEGLGAYDDVVEVAKPSVSRLEWARQMGLKENDAKLETLVERLEDFNQKVKELPDRSADVETRLIWEEADRVFQRQMLAYEAYSDGLEVKQARFEELEGWVEVAEDLAKRVSEAQAYEATKASYEKAQRVFDQNKAVYEGLVEKADKYLESRKAVQELKVRIKTQLLPSLNSVASMLLNQMTGGERYKIDVDADFEILVDDQRIHTLSGSAKAVANLAIRLALGQILTNRVFSVFMADEIDASMDEERAEHTAQALRRLTSHVSQVIQVTHKRPETDHTIELNK